MFEYLYVLYDSKNANTVKKAARRREHECMSGTSSITDSHGRNQESDESAGFFKGPWALPETNIFRPRE